MRRRAPKDDATREAASPPEGIIDVRGLTKVFRVKEKGQRTAVRSFRAVDDVSLRVGRGEILGVLGPNGAGKTTLIKMLCGLLVPDRGAGTVLGFDVLHRAAAIRSRVSLVAPTADIGTDNNLTVRENLQFWAAVYGIPRREKKQRIDELLVLVDLKDREDTWPMNISAGMRQRLAIARSLLAENELLFLDEPTVKLDPDGARRIREFVLRINREDRVTILLTTHLMYEAEELCSRIIVLDGGRIVAQGTAQELKRLVRGERIIEIFASGLPAGTASADAPSADAPSADIESSIRLLPSVLEVELDVWDGAVGQGRLLVKTADVDRTTALLLPLLQDAGARVEGVRSGEPNLEDVFFTLTGRGLAK